MVDAIWSDMDIQYPPAVERLPRHASATIARANRLSLFLSDLTPAWCLLHEIAHAMTTTADGPSDGHGPIFMEIYLRLLVRYLRFDEMEMRRLLQDAGINVARNARPVFLDR
jgi:hypothetical protein